MKTTISLPDELFAQAEAEAKRLNVSRSEIYANAIRAYVNRTRDAAITARLNEAYGANPSTIDPDLAEAQLRVLLRDKW